MFFAGLRSLAGKHWLRWVVALIALDASLGFWLYGSYTQALGQKLVYIENAVFHQFEIQPRIDLSERQSGVLIRQRLGPSAP